MLNPLQLVERRIGFIYSEDGYYEPDEITFTVEEGVRVEIGDIICIKHPSKNTLVFYQVIEVPVRRRARDYEEDLARIGSPLFDESRNYPRAHARQIGYVEDLEKLVKGEARIDDLVMLIEHIKPLSEVYAPRAEIIDQLLRPEGDSIVVGKIYPNWKHEYRLNLQRLLRQGLLVVGGVGTGKTTTMLNIVHRIMKTIIENGGAPRLVLIDKDGEYGVEELVRLVGEDNYLHVHVDEIGELEFTDKEAYVKKLLKELGLTDLRTKAAKAIRDVVSSLSEEVYVLTPEFVKQKILPQVAKRYQDTYTIIVEKINSWSKKISGKPPGVGVLNILEFLKKNTAIVHIDLSATRDYNHAYSVINQLLRMIYETALDDQSFGCIVVIDEAHLFAPERGGISLAGDDETGELRETIQLIATTGPRNGVTLFIATQRPSLISKTITTQMGQNIIAHRVEDVDLERIEEIVGPIARRVRVLPRGWAIVKGLAAKVREPMIVRVDVEIYPRSHGKTTYERLMARQSS